jgi:release factor glutamine methyltransferase
MSVTIQDILRENSHRLLSTLELDVATARIEVQSLLQVVLKVSCAYLLTYPEQFLTDEQQAQYTQLFERRLNGEPLAYILGDREFYGLNFKVTPATLIPRADTELLVELVLQRISQAFPRGRGGLFRVLDLGTGSGAIALAIANSKPDVAVTAVEFSLAALDVARENAQSLDINNVRLLRSDWFSALQGERFDLIVSNPPYIADADVHLTQGDLRFEPSQALSSGADGLDDIRTIIAEAGNYLAPGGWLMLEHGYNQAASVCTLLQQVGFAEIFSAKDIAGIERVSGAMALNPSQLFPCQRGVRPHAT